MNTIYDDDQGIVIFGPQGCGKTTNAEALRRHFGKAQVVEAGFPLVVPHDAIVLTNLEGGQFDCLNKVSYEWAMADMAGAGGLPVDRKKVQYHLGEKMSTFTYALQGAEHKAFQSVRALKDSGLSGSELFRELNEIANRLKTINSRVQASQSIEITLDNVCDECDGTGKSYHRAPYARERGWHECQTCFHKEQERRVEAQNDPWKSLIVDYLSSSDNLDKEQFTSAEILINACQIDPQNIQRADQHRISPLMKALGWVSTRKHTEVDGEIKQSRVYVRPVLKEALPVGGLAPDIGG